MTKNLYMVHYIFTARIPHGLESAGLVHHLHPQLGHAVIIGARVFHLELELLTIFRDIFLNIWRKIFFKQMNEL